MGGAQGKEIPRRSPLGCILAHWRDIAGEPGETLNKKTLVKYCNQWWSLYKLEDGEKWPLNGTMNYNTTLQLMLFLRREGKWDEVIYADMFFTLRDHPEWRKDCGMGVPRDPFVLTLEKERREKGENKVKHCCSSCSIGQQCMKLGNIRESEELLEHYQPPVETPPPQDGAQEGAQAPPGAQDGEQVPPGAQAPSEVQAPSGAQAPPDSPIASWTRSQQPLIIAPLREAVGPNGEPVLIKVPFSSFDLETWKLVAKGYRNDPLGVTRHFQFLIRQHKPDWSDIQLLLDQLTETEKQLILKTAQTLVEDSIRGRGEDVKDHFPLQNPYWDANTRAGRERLGMYREWVVKGMERAIPKTINWSNLFAVRQGPKESPSEFLDKLRDAWLK